MTALYTQSQVSKQAAFQAWQRQEHLLMVVEDLQEQVAAIRCDHPVMGLRKIYHMLAPLPVGRDRFETLMGEVGLGVARTHSAHITTRPQRHLLYPNLVEGTTITGMHQIWATDITYYRLGSRFAYLVFLMDVYTRVILAAVASTHMRAEANIEALRRALAFSAGQRVSLSTVHHSDRGGQYIDIEYCRLLSSHGFEISMCAYAYQNAYIERVQGTIKNEYLQHRSIHYVDQLQEELDRAVLLYNTERPHQALPNWMTPSAYASLVTSLPEERRPRMTIYIDEEMQQTPTALWKPNGVTISDRKNRVV
jgi:putative transposase